jgi:hypothetical protein
LLEDALEQTIPSQVRLFPKLKAGRDPYRFYRWDFDADTGSPVLRYWFWSSDRGRKYRKRVFISEAERLLERSLGSGEVTRQDFRRFCPRTDSDGGCGFAVIVAMFEFLGLVRHTDERGVYEIVNRRVARQILAD